MRGEANIATVAALIGDPARAGILTALADGRALPAGELATSAGLSPSAASTHLTKLLEGGLLALECQGRHRYYRLAGPEVARARLAAAHPGLDDHRLDELVARGTRPAPAGGLVWKWDPYVREWAALFDRERFEEAWAAVRCPTMVVTGGEAWERWWKPTAAVRPGPAFDGPMTDAERDRRLGLFADVEHHVVAAGHMVHFDRPAEVIALLETTALQVERVLRNPAPKALLLSYGDSAINYALRFWIANPMDNGGICSEVNQAIWHAFSEHNIEIPFPQQVQYSLPGAPEQYRPDARMS